MGIGSGHRLFVTGMHISHIPFSSWIPLCQVLRSLRFTLQTSHPAVSLPQSLRGWQEKEMPGSDRGQVPAPSQQQPEHQQLCQLPESLAHR